MEGKPARIDVQTFQRALLAKAPELRRWLMAKIPAKLRAAIAIEDVLQDIWTAAFRGLPAFRLDGRDALDRWLTCIAQRVVVNTIKCASRLKRGGGQDVVGQAPDRATSLVNLFEGVASPERSPSGEAAAGEAVDAVQIALATLPPARRQAVWMRYIEGLPCEEIAKAMNRTTPAVNALLFHGLRQLQEQLGDAGRFFSDVSLPLANKGEHS